MGNTDKTLIHNSGLVNICVTNIVNKLFLRRLKRFSPISSCHKQNQTLSSIIPIRSINTLETKMTPLSFLINH